MVQVKRVKGEHIKLKKAHKIAGIPVNRILASPLSGQADAQILYHGIKGWQFWLHLRLLLFYESGAQ